MFKKLSTKQKRMRPLKKRVIKRHQNETKNNSSDEDHIRTPSTKKRNRINSSDELDNTKQNSVTDQHANEDHIHTPSPKKRNRINSSDELDNTKQNSVTDDHANNTQNINTITNCSSRDINEILVGHTNLTKSPVKNDGIEQNLKENVQELQGTNVVTENNLEDNKETVLDQITVKDTPTKNDNIETDFNSVNKTQGSKDSQTISQYSVEDDSKEISGTAVQRSPDKNQLEATLKTEDDSIDEHITKSPLITVCKTEDLCRTPLKNNKLSCSTETLIINPLTLESSSPLKTDLTPLHSKIDKTLQETPVSKGKRKKGLTGNNTPQYAPSQRKKRKVSTASDFDQLSDTIKSELCDPVTLNEYEAIDLLHDLDTVMDFENTKLCTDVFLSSITNDIIQDSYGSADVSKDPSDDPLFIASNDEKDLPAKSKKKSIKSTPKGKSLRTKSLELAASKLKAMPIKKSKDKTSAKNKTKNSKNKKLDDDNSDKNSEISMDEEENLSFEDFKMKLSNLNVCLIHEVPDQHDIEHKAGAKPPTLEEKKLFVQYGPLRKGVFSPQEDLIIVNNWKKFCNLHNWNPKYTRPFIKMRENNKFYIPDFEERKRFVQFLANGLPWRSLYSVYFRFKNLYEKNDKTHYRYTVEEDQEILSYMKNKTTRKSILKAYSELSELLGRRKHSIWSRYKMLQKTDTNTDTNVLTSVKWTIPLIEKFVKFLLNITASENIEELRNATIPRPVWEKMESKMKIDHTVLKTFWLNQLHMQLFCSSTIYLNDIKIQLIEYVYGKGVTNTREIIWPNVAKYFDGYTTIFLCKTFFHLVRDATLKTHLKDFPGILDFLYTKKIAGIRDQATDKFLPRLSYHNGKIQIIEEE